MFEHRNSSSVSANGGEQRPLLAAGTKENEKMPGEEANHFDVRVKL